MTSRFLKAQLRAIKALAGNESIEIERLSQEKLGGILQRRTHKKIDAQQLDFADFTSAMVTPPQSDCSGVVLYLHGGGYCCGGQEYARGYGSILAASANVRVFCPAYRLAPENPYPAALDDAMQAYRYLLEQYPPEKIILVGESAGGGLIYCVCLRAKQEGLPLPGGLIAISPWSDLTASGASYQENAEVDPSMQGSRLHHYAELYSKDLSYPLVSPLFGDLSDLPESLIFVGGDEIMRDDAVQLHRKLLRSSCKSTLVVAEGLWHAYILYRLKDRKQDDELINAFVRRITK